VVTINQSGAYITFIALNSKLSCFAGVSPLAFTEADLKVNSDEASFCFTPNTIRHSRQTLANTNCNTVAFDHNFTKCNSFFGFQFD
jgi:hypothetical protein